MQKEIAYQSHLFFKGIPNFWEIPEIKEKIQKKFFGFQRIAFELVALNTRFY